MPLMDRGDLDRLLIMLAELDGSDLHLKAGAPPRMRIAGSLRILSDEPSFTAEETLQLAEGIMQPSLLETFRARHEVDFAYSVPGTGRFRVNAFYQRSSVALAMRRVRTSAATVAELGLPDIVSRMANEQRGLLLVTGPTGSGKSTTLYTTLTALNSAEKNIITVEDPVELQIKGINQVQLNVKAGLTFPAALKSILRSDPDIVLVGEIRDRETAVTAIEAALTGHLVLSTLHTNNAASTPMRLIEMGIEPFLVTSALSAILAQRLARRLCVHCKEAFQPTEADIVAAGWRVEEVERADGIPKLYRAVGCSACSNTGYRGRKALAELMPMTEEIERMIIEGGSVDEIHRLAVSQGMVTLRESGLRKAIEGETTLEEVLRVVA